MDGTLVRTWPDVLEDKSLEIFRWIMTALVLGALVLDLLVLFVYCR